MVASNATVVQINAKSALPMPACKVTVSVSAKQVSSSTARQTLAPAATHRASLVPMATAVRLAQLAKSKTQRACASAQLVPSWTKRRKRASRVGPRVPHALQRISATLAQLISL